MQADSRPDDDRRRPRHAALHEPRAGAGPAGDRRSPHRHLLAGRDALRAADAPRRPSPATTGTRCCARSSRRSRLRCAVLNPAIPRDLETIVLKAMAKDVAGRYATARDLADDLRRFLDHQPIQARRPSLWTRARKMVRRHPAALLVLAVVLASATILLMVRLGYEARLDAARRLSQQKDEQARARELENQRHLQYVRDIRQADRLIRPSRATLAQEILMRYSSGRGEDDLREFTWYYLLRRCHTERHTHSRHHGDVYHVEFSPRGDLLATRARTEPFSSGTRHPGNLSVPSRYRGPRSMSRPSRPTEKPRDR